MSNVVLGGTAFSVGHDFWLTLILGALVYLATICLRWISTGDRVLPSLTMAILGLALGVVISSGIDAVRAHDHRQELSDWYAGLSDLDRMNVRGDVHRWMESLNTVQRDSLSAMAQLTGYADPGDYVVLNYCSPTNTALAAIWKRAGLPTAVSDRGSR